MTVPDSTGNNCPGSHLRVHTDQTGRGICPICFRDYPVGKTGLRTHRKAALKIEQEWIRHHARDLGHKTIRMEVGVLRCTCGAVYDRKALR